MGLGQKWPNCDPEIREYILNIVDVLERDLNENLVAVYLHGSLAMGSFYAPKSDIDILVLVHRKLKSDKKRKIIDAIMHVPHYRQGDENPLEISIILQKYAKNPSHPVPYELHYSGDHTQDVLTGDFDYESKNLKDEDLAAHMRVVYERGMALCGPDPENLLSRVTEETYDQAIEADIAWILKDENICESPVYGVLNLCRYLNRCENKQVISKEEAGIWALENAPAIYKPLIGQVLTAYRSADPIFNKKQRQMAGCSWDKTALLAFAEYVRQV